MKKMFIVPMLVALATICSCQKQDSTAEAQLAQRKTELDVREEALVQREKAVDDREKMVAEREKAVANSRIIPSRSQPLDAAQAQAEREKRIQQLPSELRALIPDPGQVHPAKTEIPEGERPDPAQLQAERERRMQQLPAEFRALILNATQMKDRLKQEQLQNQGGAASSAAEITSPTASPAVEDSSAIASP